VARLFQRGDESLLQRRRLSLSPVFKWDDDGGGGGGLMGGIDACVVLF
jgi:hypothetical protein